MAQPERCRPPRPAPRWDPLELLIYLSGAVLLLALIFGIALDLNFKG